MHWAEVKNRTCSFVCVLSYFCFNLNHQNARYSYDWKTSKDHTLALKYHNQFEKISSLILRKRNFKRVIFLKNVFPLKILPFQGAVLDVPANEKYVLKAEIFFQSVVQSVSNNMELNLFKYISEPRSLCISRESFFSVLELFIFTIFLEHFSSPNLLHPQVFSKDLDGQNFYKMDCVKTLTKMEKT